MYKSFYLFKSFFGLTFFFINEIIFRKINKNSQSVLFIHTSGLGDLVHSSKIINSLSNSQLRIFFLVKSSHKQFYDEYKGDVRILSVDYPNYKINLVYRFFFLRKLRANNFNYSFILNQHRLLTDDDIAIHCGAKKIVALNAHDPRYIKLGRRFIESKYEQILFQDYVYVEKKYDTLLNEYFNLTLFKQSSLYFENSNEIKDIPDYLDTDIISCQPYSLSTNRNWQKEKYIELFEYLLKTLDSKILLFGESSQRDSLQKLVINEKRVINLAGQLNLKLVNYLLSKSKIYIGIDSAISHMAEKLEVKRIIIAGGGSYGINHPQNAFLNVDKKVKFIFSEMNCFGCNWICSQKLPYCITNITTEQVIQNIKILIGK